MVISSSMVLLIVSVFVDGSFNSLFCFDRMGFVVYFTRVDIFMF